MIEYAKICKIKLYWIYGLLFKLVPDQSNFKTI